MNVVDGRKAELDVPTVDTQHTNPVNVRDTATSEMALPAYMPSELAAHS
jgi:hypothetical protein